MVTIQCAVEKARFAELTSQDAGGAGADIPYSDMKEPGNLDVKKAEAGDLNVISDDAKKSSLQTLHSGNIWAASRQTKNWAETCEIAPLPPPSPPSLRLPPSLRSPPPSSLGKDVCAPPNVRPDLAFSPPT